MTDRLKRTRLLLGDKALARLKQARVMVVGCGAVGGMALEMLARSGIGTLIVVDFDAVSVSNINRQILALSSNIGTLKTKAAAERIQAISPDICVERLDLLLNGKTIDQICAARPDFVIDAIDSLNPKAILIETLMRHQIPFISSMGAALKTDLSQIMRTSMDKTKECPLAFFLRKRLRRRGVPLTFPVIFSKECVADKTHLAEPDEPAPDNARARHVMGSLGTVTGIFGLMCAHEAIMYLKEASHG